MKNFNQVEDQLLNGLAVDFANGNGVAGERFMEVIEPKIRNYSKKQYSELEKEDLTQEFMVEAIKACYEFSERYANSGMNVMALIWKKCRQRLIDLGRGDGAEKRSRKMTIGDDVVNREVSLQVQIGEDGESTFADKVASVQKSVEELVLESKNQKTLETVVNEFNGFTKGRNGVIVSLVFEASKQGLENDELNGLIESFLLAETGKQPTNETVRQAKSRALKALKNAILDGKIEGVNQLEWEF